ncbi:MAG TPA: TonB family protein [Steroidobacteraceae bacterium]|nr:TonB family protein [Steroidobacteraceae bacterium]
MQTQAVKILMSLAGLIGASVPAVAQAPSPAPAANPASEGPSFRESDQVPDLAGYGDAYSLNEIRIGGTTLSEAQQVSRWQAELKAGRARAGALAGAYAAYRALIPSDCAAARDTLLKADELGSDQAAFLLAQLAANETCGDTDRAELERWLKKAVTLDYPGAAVDLLNFYADADPPDRVQQYVYARVAADYWDSNKLTQPRTGFDAAALADMEKALSAEERGRAQAEAAKILETMLKRHDRFGSVTPVEFARGGAGAKSSYAGYTLDYRHECQWNLQGNCRGAQRLAYVELTNKDDGFIACKLVLQARDFVTGEPETEPATREVLVGPQATRKLLLGDVSEQPDKKALNATCKAVPKLAANSAAGKCRARLQGNVDVEKFYPPAARQRGIEGSTVVRFWVPPGSEVATDGEIATSSGDASLDAAALATVRSGKYTRECDYGLGTIRISFKLQDAPQTP